MPLTEFAIYLVHIFAVISWVGAMYFNLVLIFPSYRAGASSIREEARLYQVQGTRAARWLYAFIVFTLVSGVLLVAMGISVWDSPLLKIKMMLLSVMTACHLIGSYFVWPRIMFATDTEVRGYLNLYQVSMLVSATMGSLAILLTYFSHLNVNFYGVTL